MVSFRATVRGNHRIVIPKDIRQILDIKIGDEVRVIDLVKLKLVESNPAKEA